MKRIKQWLAARRLEAITRARRHSAAMPSRSHRKGWKTRREKAAAERAERFRGDPIIKEVAAPKERIHSKDAMLLRSALYLRDGARCHYCGAGLQIADWKAPSYATIEHKIPLFVGGSYDMGNLVLACQPCNSKRGHAIGHIALKVRSLLAGAQA